MKIYKVGEKSKGACDKCRTLVATTFKIKEVPLSSGKGVVRDILCAVCDTCSGIVSIPQQSAPRIRESMSVKKHSIEVRLPRHLLDILLLASDQFDFGNPELLKDSLIRHYIAIASQSKEMAKNIKKFSKSDFAAGSGYRLSLKVNTGIYDRFERLRKSTNLSKTNLIKGLILQINEDMLQKKLKKHLKEVRQVLLASA